MTRLRDPRTALTADEWLALNRQLRDLYFELANAADNQPVYLEERIPFERPETV